MYLYVPFGVALRIRRICSREDWFEEQLFEYKQYFKRRNYKNCVIQKGFEKARNIPRSQALKSKASSDQTVRKFALILDYHLNFSSLPLLIRDRLKILFESPLMRKVFSRDKTCIRTGSRRTKISKVCLSNHLCNLLPRPRLIIQVDSNAIPRFVMLVKTLYFPIDILLVLLLAKVTKLDTCLVGLILSFIVLFVKIVIYSASVQPLILDAVCPAIRAT